MSGLSLEQFREIIGYNPWHFWGMSYDLGAARVSSSCNAVVRKYAWQNVDAAGRSDIQAAIEQAEGKLLRYLGYSVCPHYVSSTVPWPRYRDPSMFRSSPIDATGRWIGIRMPEGFIQQAGIEARSVIQLGATVTLSDADGDGIYDMASISVTTSVTDPDEIAVYFTAVDRVFAYDASLSESWRIQPLNVTISGGTALIVGPAWIFVDPIRYEGASAADVDPTVAANYVATVDVYRRYTDTEGNTNSTSQAMLIWETSPCSGWWCSSCCGDATYTPLDSGSDPAARALAIARVGIRHAEEGIVTPAQALYNTTTGIWTEEHFDTCYEPDRVTVRYLAGLSLVNGQMPRYWQTVVARLAAAELAKNICACEKASRELHRWQFDLSRTDGDNDESYGGTSDEDLNNPLGTRRGHIQAWRAVVNERNLHGFLP